MYCLSACSISFIFITFIFNHLKHLFWHHWNMTTPVFPVFQQSDWLTLSLCWCDDLWTSSKAQEVEFSLLQAVPCCFLLSGFVCSFGVWDVFLSYLFSCKKKHPGSANSGLAGFSGLGKSWEFLETDFIAIFPSSLLGVHSQPSSPHRHVEELDFCSSWNGFKIPWVPRKFCWPHLRGTFCA